MFFVFFPVIWGFVSASKAHTRRTLFSHFTLQTDIRVNGNKYGCGCRRCSGHNEVFSHDRNVGVLQVLRATWGTVYFFLVWPQEPGTMYPEDCHCVWLTPLHKILSCMIYTLFNWSWKSGGIRTHKASERCMSCWYMFHWSNWSSPPNECAVPALVSFFYGSCVLSCENTFCPAARLHPKKNTVPSARRGVRLHRRCVWDEISLLHVPLHGGAGESYDQGWCHWWMDGLSGCGVKMLFWPLRKKRKKRVDV